jgi:hypothetical protein
LLDEQADLQLSDIRSTRYTNQFSPIELDELTAAEPEGALWLRFRLPGKHEQVLRVFAPTCALNLYVLDGDKLIEQRRPAPTSQAERPLPSSDLMLPLPQSDKPSTSTCAWSPNTSCARTSPCNRR